MWVDAEDDHSGHNRQDRVTTDREPSASTCPALLMPVSSVKCSKQCEGDGKAGPENCRVDGRGTEQSHELRIGMKITTPESPEAAGRTEER